MSLKPCPFCGNKMSGYPDYTITFKRDKKKVYGVYHEICTLKCNRCTCTVQQAGATRDEAEQNVSNIWNKRAEPQRKKGKWIRNNDSDHAWKCSVCGCGYTDYILTYCYDCGAKMERGEDDNCTNDYTCY